MTQLFDNIEKKLLPALCKDLEQARRADFCIGYFNLRGWRLLSPAIQHWPNSKENCCRILIGMHKLPQQELDDDMAAQLAQDDRHSSVVRSYHLDHQQIQKQKKLLLEEFYQQLTLGFPSEEDEQALQHLTQQMQDKKVIVKLFLRSPLHSKLYLLFQPEQVIGYVGSSNLTMAGLSYQGELNLDISDAETTQKLVHWFEQRWNDPLCMDISLDIAGVLEKSWAKKALVPPYYIYLKMIYHLCHDVRQCLTKWEIPEKISDQLFDFQKAAVKMAIQYLQTRGGIILGDVVGLGKTRMALAIASILEAEYHYSILIICPKNLVGMWEDAKQAYIPQARIMPMSMVGKELPGASPYRLVIIDESHNFRNPDGQRYKIIRDYIQGNGSKAILLSATPYNKTYLDLSSQLGLFVSDEQDLGIKPEAKIKEVGGDAAFEANHQCGLRTLKAFEKSASPDDWRQLMRLFLIRRTRSFIKKNYAQNDEHDPTRQYLVLKENERSYFPDRIPKTISFPVDESSPYDQYARLYTAEVIDAIAQLKLPRYGLGNYIATCYKEPALFCMAPRPPTKKEQEQLKRLSHAGKRLIGFCRVNLFKRLESSGQAFILSLQRHILRNFVFLYAIENKLSLPIGTQDASLLDQLSLDQEMELPNSIEIAKIEDDVPPMFVIALQQQAARIYQQYASPHQAKFEWLDSKFEWLDSRFFSDELTNALQSDAEALWQILQSCGTWNPAQDAKLHVLYQLLQEKHPQQKVLVFSQFADTIDYLTQELKKRNITQIEGVTGHSPDPAQLAIRFSPCSNGKRDKISPHEELRILLATDVLSEGQNLQDGSIVVNYDLPWAIIRLIQRMGRVDRIGQQQSQVLCYSFLPAQGVEQLLKLHSRIRQRLQENEEVVGTDELIFEENEARHNQSISDLYHEQSGILDGDDDADVDFSSYAYQIWKNALAQNPSLEKIIPNLPAMAYSTREDNAKPGKSGVLVYARTAYGVDAFQWMSHDGHIISESPLTILQAAECSPDTKALPRQTGHHKLVRKCLGLIQAEARRSTGGHLGSPRSIRRQVYTRLEHFIHQQSPSLYNGAEDTTELAKALDQIYQQPLKETVMESLYQKLRNDISDQLLADVIVQWHSNGQLCIPATEPPTASPHIICSMNLVKQQE